MSRSKSRGHSEKNEIAKEAEEEKEDEEEEKNLRMLGFSVVAVVAQLLIALSSRPGKSAGDQKSAWL